MIMATSELYVFVLDDIRSLLLHLYLNPISIFISRQVGTTIYQFFNISYLPPKMTEKKENDICFTCEYMSGEYMC